MFKKLNRKVVNEIVTNIDAKAFAAKYPSWKGMERAETDLMTVSKEQGKKKVVFHLDAIIGHNDVDSFLTIAEDGAEPLARFELSKFIDPEIAFEVAKAALLRLAD